MSVNVHVNWKLHKRFFKFFVTLAVLYSSVTYFSFPIVSHVFGLSSMSSMTFFRYAYIEIFRWIYLIQYVLACFVVQTRFYRFNGLVGSGYFTLKSRDVVKVGQLFHKLCDSIDILNGTFTFHFIAIFTNALVRKTEIKNKIFFLFYLKYFYFKRF